MVRAGAVGPPEAGPSGSGKARQVGDWPRRAEATSTKGEGDEARLGQGRGPTSQSSPPFGHPEDFLRGGVGLGASRPRVPCPPLPLTCGGGRGGPGGERIGGGKGPAGSPAGCGPEQTLRRGPTVTGGGSNPWGQARPTATLGEAPPPQHLFLLYNLTLPITAEVPHHCLLQVFTAAGILEESAAKSLEH